MDSNVLFNSWCLHYLQCNLTVWSETQVCYDRILKQRWGVGCRALLKSLLCNSTPWDLFHFQTSVFSPHRHHKWHHLRQFIRKCSTRGSTTEGFTVSMYSCQFGMFSHLIMDCFSLMHESLYPWRSTSTRIVLVPLSLSVCLFGRMTVFSARCPLPSTFFSFFMITVSSIYILPFPTFFFMFYAHFQVHNCI